jgi:hypothetical protein
VYQRNFQGLTHDQVKQQRLNAKEQINKKFDIMQQEEAKVPLPTNAGGMSVEEQLKTDIKSMTYDQVNDYIEAQNKLNKLADGFRYKYKVYKDAQGKEVLVRCLQALE